MILEEHIEERLRSLSVQRLAEMWCELNGWDWPKELKDIRPDDFHNHKGPINQTLGWQIMERMRWIISDKTISRAWNKDMPDEKFERWYPAQRAEDLK